MTESAESLQDICINFLSQNIIHFTKVFGEQARNNFFKYSDICFPSNVSEQLLDGVCQKTVITDRMLQFFDEEATRLEVVRIENASELTTKGLSILRRHKVRHLQLKHLTQITVNDVIGCLGEWTLRHLQSLNVSHSTILNKDKICVIVALSKLKNLCALDVSNTDFNFQSLEIITQDLPLLDTLNLSEVPVREITPLRKCRSRLKHLSMHNFQFRNSVNFVTVLHDLDQLCYLDISDDKSDPFNLITRNIYDIMPAFLNNKHCLPNLVSLDISGKNGIFIDDLRFFLKSHPKLKFLGLMFTDACFDNMFLKDTDPDYDPELVVSGCGSEIQIIESLIRYLPRRSYTQKSLYCLYSYTDKFNDRPIDPIKLILRGMERYPNVIGIQMSATASLYNLSKANLVHMIHPCWLKKIVDLTLTAMERFPKHPQLQKNGLLTLCNDRILHDVTFDRYRCARLVMESLISFDEAPMNRMSVAICSILAAKISTSQTSSLGTKANYMERLLGIVRSKTAGGEVDIMMKFTLSALWNLTDESPETCTVFLNLGGMDLFLRVLKSFCGEVSVETKILGLMNNIAEVPHLRPFLMKDELLATLRTHLHSDQVDVSYFAAGIIAHLASDGHTAWTCSSIPRMDILRDLRHTVLGWKTPDNEMVAYRSFTPFLALLNCVETWESQLWAVWAVHHIISKNPRRYWPMLLEEGGEQLILRLLQKPTLNSSVRAYCQKIVNMVHNP